MVRFYYILHACMTSEGGCRARPRTPPSESALSVPLSPLVLTPPIRSPRRGEEGGQEGKEGVELVAFEKVLEGEEVVRQEEGCRRGGGPSRLALCCLE